MTTTREQLQALIAEVQADQTIALEELDAFLGSETEGGAFVTKLEEIRNRTLPGGQHDQILGSLLQVIASVKKMAETVAPKQPELPEDPTVTEISDDQEEAKTSS